MHCFVIACQYLLNDKHFATFCHGISSLYAKILPNKPDMAIVHNNDSGNSATIEISSSIDVSPSSANNNSNGLTELGIVIVYGSTLAEKYNCKGWWRDSSFWVLKGTSANKITKSRPSHIIRASTDFKFRSRLCSHW